MNGNKVIDPSPYLLGLLPIFILQMGLLGQGMGMLISSMTIKYRDLRHLVNFGTQLLMYASPIVYPLSIVPDDYKIFIYFNPMTSIIEGFRFAFLGSGQLTYDLFIYSFITTLVIFIFGLIIFNRVEKKLYRHYMKSREKAVVIENLSKKYNLGVISTKTLSGDISKLVKSVFGIEDNAEPLISRNRLDTYSSEKEVWALRNLSIDIKKGDVIGVVGKNGAGKSTLLKILSRITTPTHGTVRINGRVASLLEVGTGFHPELTGKENIYLNGAILGMKKFEIDQKLDEIVEFSGIKKYISTPVKRYSSGMRVRLAFSVAAHLEADILLVDEVLAVGDAEFQKKAIGKIKSVTNEKLRTVLFVSHNLGSIKQLCEKSILLKNGELIAFSDTSKIISTYLKDGLKEVHNTNLKAIKDRRGINQ